MQTVRLDTYYYYIRSMYGQLKHEIKFILAEFSF